MNTEMQKQPPDMLPQACNFIKKETLAQVRSCGFFELSRNTFFIEHLWTTASANVKYFYI